ncbi:MAG TPA: Zn-dependent hydrolase [Bacteroidales bacterium]|nr:Zn-dependent hydrolase [Bacteroidales bacterium]HOR60051.1 Zn-dependent hydrolase [Bacteroidales bacterium]HPL03627.1 Zn-dependent hydrolase [Bacteroidales bacterium]
MKINFLNLLVIATLVVAMSACNSKKKEETKKEELTEMQKLVADYAEVELTANLDHLTDGDKQAIVKLVEVAQIMDDLFWKDAIGDKEAFLNSIEDEDALKYALINYGPWDRLNGNKSFIAAYGEKPLGANYYPSDITKEEFNAFDDPNKMSWYTLISRDDAGKLKCVWYHEEYAQEIERAAQLIDEAAELVSDKEFQTYLRLRAEALRTDDYLTSDLAWMDMKNNKIDFVVGPIESYEDAFMGVKAAHSGQILIKDLEWSKNIEHFNEVLPQLQAGLPVAPEYKTESATNSGDMNVYNAIYYGGDCNSGSKNIAINLPNDPRVHATKGSRKLQLKNSMEAKFNTILLPIAELLIDETQLKHVKFEDAFFQNVMFHEVAHGLGVKYTIDSKKSVREALEEYYSPVEEAKADIAGLYMVTQLYEMGEFPEKDLMDNYVTFMAGIFRSVRFGVASSHGKANMMEFYYLKERGAFVKNEETGKYSVNFEKMKAAVAEMVNDIIVIQGDGNLEAAKNWVDTQSNIGEELQKDLDKIAEAGIPKDIVFKQGLEVLGLKK